MEIEPESDPFRPEAERPKATVLRMEELGATTTHESDFGCNFDHPVWEYDIPESRWFDKGALLKLDPGVYSDFHAHRREADGAVERMLRVFAGRGVLRTERADIPLDRFDHVAVPTGAAYQLGNVDTDPLWVGSWYSVGGDDFDAESTLDPTMRAGAREEYDRIMDVRAQHGLSTAPGYEAGDASVGDGATTDEGEAGAEQRPTPAVDAFADIKPKTRYEAPEVGCNADWLTWMTTFDPLEWFSDSAVMKLEPGGYTGLHTHFENEGPHEEVYWVMEGDARVVTEYRDARLNRFDCAFFPTGNPHAIGNIGTDTLWFPPGTPMPSAISAGPAVGRGVGDSRRHRGRVRPRRPRDRPATGTGRRVLARDGRPEGAWPSAPPERRDHGHGAPRCGRETTLSESRLGRRAAALGPRKTIVDL
jgi:oxalate decarboxylase/phosphoglucose isomerase-like protein (cupin superfamily)